MKKKHLQKIGIDPHQDDVKNTIQYGHELEIKLRNNKLNNDNMIQRFFKQLFCKHDWRTKGNPDTTPDFYYQQYRCPKCKKQKHKHIIY